MQKIHAPSVEYQLLYNDDRCHLYVVMHCVLHTEI